MTNWLVESNELLLLSMITQSEIGKTPGLLSTCWSRFLKNSPFLHALGWVTRTHVSADNLWFTIADNEWPITYSCYDSDDDIVVWRHTILEEYRLRSTFRRLFYDRKKVCSCPCIKCNVGWTDEGSGEEMVTRWSKNTYLLYPRGNVPRKVYEWEPWLLQAG